MSNRGIGRARMFMGTLLLLAAALTWGIIFTVSPHGEPAASGPDYVRGTILTLKRNGAVGTLILSALAAWLLFPSRRPKWPARDWSLATILALLAGSSVYTLASSQRFSARAADNAQASDMNVEWNSTQAEFGTNGMELNATPEPVSNEFASGGPMVAPRAVLRRRQSERESEIAGEESRQEQPVQATEPVPTANAIDVTVNESDQNQQ